MNGAQDAEFAGSRLDVGMEKHASSEAEPSVTQLSVTVDVPVKLSTALLASSSFPNLELLTQPLQTSLTSVAPLPPPIRLLITLSFLSGHKAHKLLMNLNNVLLVLGYLAVALTSVEM